MKTTNRSFLTALCVSLGLLASGSVSAAGGGDVHLDSANINLRDQGSLQRGAKAFITNCLNCHSTQFMRWGHLTQIGLTEDQIKAWVEAALTGEDLDLDGDGNTDFDAGKDAVSGLKDLLDYNNNLELM